LFSSTCLLQYPSPSYIKPLSLHDALPIYKVHPTGKGQHDLALFHVIHHTGTIRIDDARLLRAFASRRAALIVITTAAFALVTFIELDAIFAGGRIETPGFVGFARIDNLVGCSLVDTQDPVADGRFIAGTDFENDRCFRPVVIGGHHLNAVAAVKIGIGGTKLWRFAGNPA